VDTVPVTVRKLVLKPVGNPIPAGHLISLEGTSAVAATQRGTAAATEDH